MIRIAAAIAALGVVCVTACGVGAGNSDTRFAVRDAVYSVSWMDPGWGEVELVDGEFGGEVDGATLRVRLATQMARGDVTGDGVDDVVVVLIADPGGSGTFYGLALRTDAGGETTNPAATLLGDRIVLHSLHVSQREILVSMTIPTNPACPSLEKSLGKP